MFGRTLSYVMANPKRQVEQAAAHMRPVRLGASAAVLQRGVDGIIHIRSAQPLAAYHRTLSDPLDHWAKTAPDRVFLAQRDAEGGWRTITYAQALAAGARIGAALLDAGSVARAAGRDPVRQRHRARAARPRRACMSACPTRRSRRPIR